MLLMCNVSHDLKFLGQKRVLAKTFSFILMYSEIIIVGY